MRCHTSSKHIAVKIDGQKRENSRPTPSGSTRRRLIACVLSLPQMPSRQPSRQENQRPLDMPFVSLPRRRREVDGWAEEKRERRSASLANREARRSFMGRMWSSYLSHCFVRPDRNSSSCASCKKLASTVFEGADNDALVTSGGLALNLKKMKKCRDSG